MSNIRHRRVGISGSLVLSSHGSARGGGEEKGEDARRRSFNDPENFREEKIPPGACSQSLSVFLPISLLLRREFPLPRW